MDNHARTCPFCSPAFMYPILPDEPQDALILDDQEDDLPS